MSVAASGHIGSSSSSPPPPLVPAVLHSSGRSSWLRMYCATAWGGWVGEGRAARWGAVPADVRPHLNRKPHPQACHLAPLHLRSSTATRHAPGSSGRRTPTSWRRLARPPLSTAVIAFGSSLEAGRMKVYCAVEQVRAGVRMQGSVSARVQCTAGGADGRKPAACSVPAPARALTGPGSTRRTSLNRSGWPGVREAGQPEV